MREQRQNITVRVRSSLFASRSLCTANVGTVSPVIVSYSYILHSISHCWWHIEAGAPVCVRWMESFASQYLRHTCMGTSGSGTWHVEPQSSWERQYNDASMCHLLEQWHYPTARPQSVFKHYDKPGGRCNGDCECLLWGRDWNLYIIEIQFML
jgi:hypothetical protein